MKEQIIAALRESKKGLHARQIASLVQDNYLTVIDELYKLQNAGLVRSVAVVDLAQMENYLLWQVI